MPPFVTADEFLAIYEDFNTLDSAVIQSHLNFIDRSYCLTAPWKNNLVARKDGILLLAAHFGTLRWFQTAQFLSASLAIASGSSPPQLQPLGEDHYKLTMFGLQFLDLRKRISIPRTGFSFG